MTETDETYQDGGYGGIYDEEGDLSDDPAIALPRLLSDGEPNPLMIWRNISECGYSCPRLEWVRKPGDPSLKEMTEKWGVTQRNLCYWKDNQGWDRQRAHFWAKVEEGQAKLEAGAMVKTRHDEMIAQREYWLHLRDGLDAMLQRGGHDTVTPKGNVVFVPLTVAELDKATTAMERINKNINATLGLSQAVRQLAELEESPTGGSPVRKMVFKMTVEEPVGQETIEPKALPEGNPLPPLDLQSQVFEGELDMESAD